MTRCQYCGKPTAPLNYHERGDCKIEDVIEHLRCQIRLRSRELIILYQSLSEAYTYLETQQGVRS